MNLRAELVLSIGLLCLMLPGSLRAQTIYTYTGDDYTYCSGTYCTGGPYALSATIDVLAGTLPANLTTPVNMAPYVSWYSFADGSGVVLTPANATEMWFSIDSTDAGGNITGWEMMVDNNTCYSGVGCGTEFWSNAESGRTWINYGNSYAIDESSLMSLQGELGEGVSQTPGCWSVDGVPAPCPPFTPTPEPSTILLLGTGLLGLSALAAPSKRHALPTRTGSGSG